LYYRNVVFIFAQYSLSAQKRTPEEKLVRYPWSKHGSFLC